MPEVLTMNRNTPSAHNSTHSLYSVVVICPLVVEGVQRLQGNVNFYLPGLKSPFSGLERLNLRKINAMTILFQPTSSEASANAFGMVAVLAEKTGLPVTLIHIENPPIISPAYDDAGMSMVTDTLLADMDTMVHNRIAAFRDELNTRFHLDQRNVGLQEEVRIGFHGEEIARAAEELDAAYIVTSVRDVPLVNRVLFGGTVNAILRHTNRPVITLPEHQPLHQFQRIGYATDFSLDDGAPDHPAAGLLPDCMMPVCTASTCMIPIWMWNMTSFVNWKRCTAQRSRKGGSPSTCRKICASWTVWSISFRSTIWICWP